MDLIIKLLVNAVAVMVGAYLLKGVEVKGFGSAVIAALLLAVANAFVKPILAFLSIPLTILTLGLFVFVINGLIILLVSALMRDFHVKNIWWAIGLSLVMGIVNTVLFTIL
ncbi:MAG: phage holin family protein [Bacteroidota bacterium]